MSTADEAARVEAAEFIRREMQDGFLHPGVIAPGSRAHDALSTLVTVAQRPQPIEATIDEWRETIHAERKRQIEKGYTDEHDREVGAAHLIDWAIDYARRGEVVAVAGMLLSVRNQLVAENGATQDQPIEVTDAMVEAAAIAVKPLFLDIGLVDLDAEDCAWDAARAALAAALNTMKEPNQ